MKSDLHQPSLSFLMGHFKLFSFLQSDFLNSDGSIEAFKAHVTAAAATDDYLNLNESLLLINEISQNCRV